MLLKSILGELGIRYLEGYEMSVRLIRCFVVLLMFSCLVYGQDIDITSFSRNGEIGWTNSVPI